MTNKKTIQKEAIKELKKYLKQGDTVYTILRHVSSSGMSRVIDCKVANKDKSISHIGYLVANALDYKYDSKKEGIRVGGCGMDMGFHIVSGLAYTLSKDQAKCLGKGKCKSNDHANGDHDYTKGNTHADAGYQLSQRWL